MTGAAAQIAACLDASFSARGFTQPGIDALRADAGISLRTLYRYYPSRDAMVIGALDHRHRVYLGCLADGMPAGPGVAPVLHVFRRLGDWLTDRAPRGCLFVEALAAHPGNAAIRLAVMRHKAEMREVLRDRLRLAAPDMAEARLDPVAEHLLLIHEGQTTLAASQGGAVATVAALDLAGAALARAGIR